MAEKENRLAAAKVCVAIDAASGVSMRRNLYSAAASAAAYRGSALHCRVRCHR